MLKRKIYSELLKWKSGHTKCLVVKGQKQVGKTYIIDEFGRKEYEIYARFDMSSGPDASEIFAKNDVDEIVSYIGIRLNLNLIPKKTLIFLDEIQECPAAFGSLKAFSIDGRYDVIASGSLLGVNRVGKKSDLPDPLTPLGYIHTITMYGLDFEEFLWGIGVHESSIRAVREAISAGKPMGGPIVEQFADLFRRYMVVGGMPAAVQAYADTKNLTASDEVHSDILSICLQDINRYNSGADAKRTAECFQSIPAQLAQSNRKFMYSRILGERSRKSADRYAENLLWIEYAGYGNFCRLLKRPVSPLAANEVRSQFKVYLSDTGLLMHMYGHDYTRSLLDRDPSADHGAVYENVVAECLTKNGIPPRYYSKRRNPGMMEIDFVVECGGIAAVEVKSGRDKEARSLRKLPDFFPVRRRILLCDGDIGRETDGVEHYPLFAAAFPELFGTDGFRWLRTL